MHSTQYWDDGVQRAQYERVDFFFTKLSSSTIAPLYATSAVQVGMGANLDYSTSAICQANVNAMLGLATATDTSEVNCATYFATTPMGVDALGLVVSLSGQARAAIMLEAVLMPTASTAGTTVGVPPAALSATLATNGFAVTTLGNIAARFVLTGLDAAATASVVRVSIYFQSK